jgi:hypothetical protein
MNESCAELNRKSSQVEFSHDGISAKSCPLSKSPSPGEEIRITLKIKMDESNENPPRRYRWPWFVLAAFLLGLALAVLWMIFDVRTVERERSPDMPSAASPVP